MSDQKQLHRDTIWPVRAFACPVCNNFTPFESERCHTCQANLGLHLPTKTMVAVIDDCATVDAQRWVRCTQHEALGCNWLAPEQQEKYQRGRCLADSLESYEDVPVERMLFDWRWMSMFFNPVNTAMGKDPLYPFDIPPPVVAKLAFIHRVVRETARRN